MYVHNVIHQLCLDEAVHFFKISYSSDIQAPPSSGCIERYCVPPGSGARALVLQVESGKERQPQPCKEEVFPVYNNLKFKQAGRVYLSPRQWESCVGMSEVPIRTIGTFAREVGILPRKDLGLPGLSGSH